MLQAIKIKLYPSDDQKIYINKLLGTTRFVYNQWSRFNRNVISVDRWFPSSKTCNSCGYKNNDLTLQDREWVCPVCGAHHDRDLNAAINNKNEGIKKLNLELQQVNSSLGMSLPEVTLTECNGLPPRRSKNQNVKSYDLI